MVKPLASGPGLRRYFHISIPAPNTQEGMNVLFNDAIKTLLFTVVFVMDMIKATYLV